MRVQRDETEAIKSIISRLKGDTELAALLAVGVGNNKIRYADQFNDETTPAVIVSIVSDSADPTVAQRHGMVFQIDVSTRAARLKSSDLPDPQSHTLAIKKRIRQLFVGARGVGRSTLPLGGCGAGTIREELDLPLRKDDGRNSEYWTATMQFRISYIR